MKERMDAWRRLWQKLVQELERRGAATLLSIDPPAPEDQIAEAEFRLGIRLPEELRSLLKEGAGRAYVYWSLPDETIMPFEVSGEAGWDIEQLEFFSFTGEELEEERRFLSFHPAGNGDELLLDLHSPSSSAVVHFAHETGEYLLLAPSLTVFLDRITQLGCVGAEEWQYPQFCGEYGLDPEKQNSRQWQAWLQQYLTLTLEQALGELPLLITYAEMFGAGTRTLAAFEHFDSGAVLESFVERASLAANSHNQEAILCLAGDVLQRKAADFVRSLWSAAPRVEISSAARAYLSARCLPEGEGLERVLNALEESGSQQNLSGYAANSQLQAFHSRRVLEWMEDKAAFPYGGWDTLYAYSQPAASDIVHWLSGRDVLRQIVIAALPVLQRNEGLRDFSPAELQQLRSLLEQALDKALLKKEKQAVRDAMELLG